jgi:hypothetical protein
MWGIAVALNAARKSFVCLLTVVVSRHSGVYV